MQLPDIVLLQPEIPPNAGNIIRLCANTGAALHLVHPLGFELSDRHLRRAGLDYAEYARVEEHDRLEDYLRRRSPARLYAFSARAERSYAEAEIQCADALLFGPETRGLPRELLETLPASQRLRIPMRPNSRSMNLANSVAVVVYDVWRRQGFPGAI